jgi:cytolysin (calcineurin-like family phosphatase)
MTGDLTDNGTLEEFAEFETFYGLTGKDALLRYPVFEAIGNHDVNSESPIKERQRARHGGINYAWEWDDVRFFCLDMYPDAKTREWLIPELRRAGPDRPVVFFFHYPVMPSTVPRAWSGAWPDEDKEEFGRATDGSNVIAIFHGHQHSSGHYTWRDRPVFRPGAAKSRNRVFLVVRIDARQMSVAGWNFETGAWAETWSVPVRREGVTGLPAVGATTGHR